jgi:lysophospholipase L1-like esterase
MPLVTILQPIFAGAAGLLQPSTTPVDLPLNVCIPLVGRGAAAWVTAPVPDNAAGAISREVAAALPALVSGAGIYPSRGSGGPQLFAVLGDSIAQRSTGTAQGPTDFGYFANGFITWAQAFSMGALWCPMVVTIGTAGTLVNYNRAVSAETAAQCRVRVAEVAALNPRPRFCAVTPGTNSIGETPSLTAAQVAADITGICADLLGLNIRPILCTILPRGNGTSNSAWASLTSGAQVTTAKEKLLEVNRLLRAYAGANPAVILADMFHSVLNFSSATSDPDVTWVPDYIHPNAAGAIRIGQALWSAVSPHIGPAPRDAASDGDGWSATGNPFGNQLASAGFGVGGGTASAGVTGTVPAGWTVGMLSGATSTATSTRQARADASPGNEVVLAMTGNDLAEFRYYPGGSNLTLANFSAGDAVFAVSNVTFSGSGANQLGNPNLELRFDNGTVRTCWGAQNYQGVQGDIRGSYTFQLRTPLCVLPSGLSSVNFWTVDGIRNGGSATVSRSDIAYRKYNRSAPGAVVW